MDYKEYLYKICTDIDYDNREDIDASLKILAREAMRYHTSAMRLEEKLKDLMTFREFTQFTKDLATDLFRQDIASFDDGGLKDFAINAFEEITGQKYEVEDGTAEG